MVEYIVVAVLLGAFVLSLAVGAGHLRHRDARRQRRSVPTSQRLASRRQFRGFEHDLLAERERAAQQRFAPDDPSLSGS
jgi:hypothetical protein